MHAAVVWSTQFTNQHTTNDIAPGGHGKGIALAGRPVVAAAPRPCPWTGWRCVRLVTQCLSHHCANHRKDILRTMLQLRDLSVNQIGGHPQHQRNLQPERVGGLAVDDELKLGRLKYGQVSGLFALENPAGITSH